MFKSNAPSSFYAVFASNLTHGFQFFHGLEPLVRVTVATNGTNVTRTVVGGLQTVGKLPSVQGYAVNVLSADISSGKVKQAYPILLL